MANQTERQILTGAKKNLETLFKDLPDYKGLEVHTEAPTSVPGRRLDAEIKVTLGKRTLRLILAATAYSQPAKLRETAQQLQASLKAAPAVRGVLCAPYISQASAEVCAAENLGYVDLCGNCRLVFEGVYLSREGKPNQYPERRETKALAGLFSLKASRVLKVLLRRVTGPWKLQDAATKAEVSLPLAFKVARILEEQELARGRRGRFTLENPEGLLRLWAGHYKPREHGRLSCYSLRSIKEVEEHFANIKSKEKTKPCALGKFSAAEYLAPLVNYSVATLYAQEDISRFAQQMQLKPVEKGGNVELIEPVDPWFFNDCCGVPGRWVTSPAQTYLDVTRDPVRGVEAGEAILKAFRILTLNLWPERDDG